MYAAHRASPNCPIFVLGMRLQAAPAKALRGKRTNLSEKYDHPLLGDSYLHDALAQMPESVAYRFFLAAAREDCAPAAQAHYRLGQWYARQQGADQHQSANAHLEKGAELGCTLCMAALAELQASTDDEFALDMRELSEIGDEFTVGRSRTRPVRRRERWPSAYGHSRPESFLDSVRGLLRGAFA